MASEFVRRTTAAVGAAWLLVALAHAEDAGVAAKESSAAASAPAAYRVSPHVLAAQRRAQAASAPMPLVSPLTMHRPHHPSAAPRGP